MNARQRGNSENKECKSGRMIQNELFIGARKEGNKFYLINKEREALRVPISIATRASPRFSNRQAIMTVEPTVTYNVPFKGAVETKKNVP